MYLGIISTKKARCLRSEINVCVRHTTTDVGVVHNSVSAPNIISFNYNSISPSFPRKEYYHTFNLLLRVDNNNGQW